MPISQEQFFKAIKHPIRANILPLMSDPTITPEQLVILNKFLPNKTKLVEKIKALLLRSGSTLVERNGTWRIYTRPSKIYDKEYYLLSRLGSLRTNTRPARSGSRLYRQHWSSFDFNTHKLSMERK